MWQHIMPLSAALSLTSIKIQVYIDPEQTPLTIDQLYSLYCAKLFGAEVIDKKQENSITFISAKDLEAAMTSLSDEICKQMQQSFLQKQIKPNHIIMPFETSVFGYADFYESMIKTEIGSIIKCSVEIPSHENDYTSWIQGINENASYGCFYFDLNCNRTGVVTQVEISKMQSYVPQQLIQAQQYDSQDQVFEKLFKQNLIRYQTKPQPANAIEIVHAEAIQQFKIFLNGTHTLATDSFLTPFVAVINQKFSFRVSETAVCFITGAVLTDLRNQDCCSYVDHQLYKSLEINCEVINIVVKYDPTIMDNMINLLQILKQNSIVVHHFKCNEVGAYVNIYSNGFKALIKLQEQVEQKFGKGSFQCSNMPQYVPTPVKPQGADYSKEKSQVPTYVSSIKSFDDITPQSIEQASQRLHNIHATDESEIIESKLFSDIIKTRIVFVLENIQQTGSFKIRGGSNLLIKAYDESQKQKQPISGVIACSAGNHAQGVAKTANLLGIKCTIVCPETAPETKLYNTLRYNSEVIKNGKVFDISNKFAIQLAQDRGWLFVPPYNHFDIIEGQGTIAHELLSKRTDITHILINVGGGGMISGMALYAKKVNPKIKIIGVQACRVFPTKDYTTTGKWTEVDKTLTTIADGCNVKVPGGIHNDVLKNYVDEYVCVDENEIAATIINTLLHTKTVTEGAGCMGLAAMLYKKVHVKETDSVAIIMCGGNIDIQRLTQIFKIGTISMGRRLKVELTLSDAPGKLLEMSLLVKRYGGIIDYVRHERYDKTVDWDCVTILLDIRMYCLQATIELKREIMKLYPKARFPAENLIPDLVQ